MVRVPVLGSSERYVSLMQSVLGVAGERGGDGPVPRRSRWRLATEGSVSRPRSCGVGDRAPFGVQGSLSSQKASTLKLQLRGSAEKARFPARDRNVLSSPWVPVLPWEAVVTAAPCPPGDQARCVLRDAEQTRKSNILF